MLAVTKAYEDLLLAKLKYYKENPAELDSNTLETLTQAVLMFEDTVGE